MQSLFSLAGRTQSDSQLYFSTETAAVVRRFHRFWEAILLLIIPSPESAIDVDTRLPG
ncbi:Uncharacterised protein [Yersinia aldovae]|uniref:Uncharacterized protein n=1 Tax=Yersinia aldovae TaxID=29483 RepID=A0A0T9SZH1_YERAL|nr:Uncharacterised protein [Yersinia aldovae]CNK52245.1 Uncharacterised protein [Yersinia aldovae]CNK60422.1 Uncharacterised protein [Yersinia aldovae]